MAEDTSKKKQHKKNNIYLSDTQAIWMASSR